MVVAWKAKFGVNPAGNSLGAISAALANFWPTPKLTKWFFQAISFAVGVDAALQIMEASGTIVIVRHVVLARPQQLHGLAYYLRDGRGFKRVIVGETASESAAGLHQMPGDVGFGDSEQLGDLRPPSRRRLRRRP